MQLKGLFLLRCCWFGLFVSSEEGVSVAVSVPETELSFSYMRAPSVCGPETELSIGIGRATQRVAKDHRIWGS
jgi:hypothetical protein